MGKEITGDAGGHAHREITPGGLAHSILKIRAKGVVIADKLFQSRQLLATSVSPWVLSR